MKPIETAIPNPGQQARSAPIPCKTGDKIKVRVVIPVPEGLEANRHIFGNLEVRSRGAFLSLDNGPGFVIAAGKPVDETYVFIVPMQTDALRLQLFTHDLDNRQEVSRPIGLVEDFIAVDLGPLDRLLNNVSRVFRRDTFRKVFHPLHRAVIEQGQLLIFRLGVVVVHYPNGPLLTLTGEPSRRLIAHLAPLLIIITLSGLRFWMFKSISRPEHVRALPTPIGV